MLHTHCQLPRFYQQRYLTLFNRLNETVLIPMRMAGFMLHIAGTVCVADYRHELIVKGSLLPGYSQSDYDYMMRIADGAIAATVACLMIVFLSFLFGRSLYSEVNNLLQLSCHMAAGGLLMSLWVNDSHVMRLWQIFYIFSIIPTAVELLFVAATFARGLTMW